MATEIAGIGIVAAFIAGTVSFLSPCVLPLVPGYLSYMAGRSVDDIADARAARARLHVLALSLFFVAGFSWVFIALGASASAVGRLLQAYRYEANYVAGTVIVLFGLHMMGLLRLDWLNRDWRFTKPPPRGRPVGAFLLGTAFAFGWTPCIGPILGAILTIGATTLGVADGAVLLSIYAMGLGLPFVLVATVTGHFTANVRKFRRVGQRLQIAAGGILVAIGILMATGQLFWFGTWMLNTFPFFQELQL